MDDAILGTDLFGDPVTPRREGRGRPEAVWDRVISNRVLLAFARGLTVKSTAALVGLSTPTLRKVYFSECAKRRDAALRMEMRQLERLNTAAEGGNVAAEKELMARLEKLRLRDTHEMRAPAPKKASKEKPLGKKDQAKANAKEVGGRFAPRQPPAMLIN